MRRRLIDVARTEVAPGSRLGRLPRPLRPPALVARHLLARVPRPSRYRFEADGMATEHLSPFLEDEEYSSEYWKVATPTWNDGIDARWRMWMLTEHARDVDALGGAFAEFGVYRGVCAHMMLSCTEASRLHLFDTFTGIPNTHLTPRERRRGMDGRLADTSLAAVQTALARWQDRTEFHAGDVFDTLADVETGDLSLVHVDLNVAAPTQRALEYSYPRLLRGGVIVFDDYGWDGYEDQRQVIDAFFADRPERVLALPTGQGLVTKRRTGP